MKISKVLAMVCMASLSPLVLALDSACQPIVDASAKKMNQTAWHSIVTLAGGMRMENIKAGGGFFRNVGGVWAKSPVNFDTAEKDMIGQINSGEVKLTQCKSLGSELLEGKLVNVISSSTEMKGAPAAESQLYIGKIDGLPYKQTGKSFQVIYKYQNIAAPKI